MMLNAATLTPIANASDSTTGIVKYGLRANDRQVSRTSCVTVMRLPPWLLYWRLSVRGIRVSASGQAETAVGAESLDFPSMSTVNAGRGASGVPASGTWTRSQIGIFLVCVQPFTRQGCWYYLRRSANETV